MLFVRIVVAIVLVFARSECATRRRFDPPPVISQYDSPSSARYIPLEAMNPMNQPKSSSYSIMETSSGSRNTATTAGGHHTGYNFAVGRRKKKRPPRPRQFQKNEPPSFHVGRVPQSRRPSKPMSQPYKKETAARFVNHPSVGHVHSEEGYDLGEHFAEKDDDKIVEAHKSREGNRAHHGNRKQESYDEEEKKKHDSEEHKIASAEKRGRKNQHSRDRTQVGKKYGARDGEKGITLKKKSGHTKNYRKSGYRRVHNKEEYKLDEEFYERSHNGKDHKERSKEYEKHAEEKAGAVKKNSHDSAHHDQRSEKKAVEEKDSLRAEKTGHKKEAEERKQENEHSKSDEKSHVQKDSEHERKDDSKSRGGFFDFDDLF